MVPYFENCKAPVTKTVENREKVEAYERALSENLPRLAEHIERVEEKFGAAGREKLGLSAWPLRPLFFDLDVLRDISNKIFEMLQNYKARLLSRLDDLDGLARELRLDPQILVAMQLGAALTDRDLLSAARPDGFLYRDRYAVSEFNVGSGLFATLSYTEVLSDLLLTGPVADSLGWLNSGPQNPFRSYIKLVRERFSEVDDPTVALLVPDEEKRHLYDWELDLFARLWRNLGIRTLVLDARDLALDSQGVLRETSEGRQIEIVIALSSGEWYLSQPDYLAEITSKLLSQGRPHAYLHPLACLCFEKGCLPLLCQSEGGDDSKKSSVGLVPSHWPDPNRATEYRLGKSDWVIKRAWTGKNTFVGHSSHGRVWNRAVESALADSTSILQEYSPLPTICMPYLIDQKIEKIPVRFELSPFLIDSDYAGALVRYAPDADGVVLSPSPADLGITIVHAS